MAVVLLWIFVLLPQPAGAQTLPYDLTDLSGQEANEYLDQEIRKLKRTAPSTSADNTFSGVNEFTDTSGLRVTSVTYTGTDGSRALVVMTSSQCTTSTSWVTVIGSTISIVVPIADRYKVSFSGPGKGADDYMQTSFLIDGAYPTPLSATIGAGPYAYHYSSTAADQTWFFITSSLAAGAHSFVMQFKSGGGASACTNVDLRSVMTFAVEPWR